MEKILLFHSLNRINNKWKNHHQQGTKRNKLQLIPTIDSKVGILQIVDHFLFCS